MAGRARGGQGLKRESITLGGGCFWCLEATLRPLKGVIEVTPGYAGGHTQNPTYAEVSTGTTGHAEVVRAVFDPDRLALKDLLEVFFAIHDPTQKDRQGPDVGPQYRSIVLYEDPAQLPVIEQALKRVEARHPRPVVTEVKPLDRFWPAEEYHHRYFEKNPHAPYCRLVVAPKVAKVRRAFAPLLEPAPPR